MIVIVSDEKYMQFGLSLEFVRNGFATCVAASEKEAKACMEQQPAGVQCLIVDADMGGANGLNLLNIMTESWPDTPCLVVSGAERRASLEKILEAGPRVVEKPFEAGEVVQLVCGLAGPE